MVEIGEIRRTISYLKYNNVYFTSISGFHSKVAREKNQSIRSSADTPKQNTHKQANMETECQSLDLHQTPNQTNPHWKPNANCWTYIGLQAHNKRIWNANRWAYIRLLTHTRRITHNKLLRSLALEPSNCQANTHKKKKGCPERSRTTSCLRTSSGMRIRAT